MLEITYGVRVTSLDDELVKTVERATVETVLAGSPGSMLVDFFPIRASPSACPLFQAYGLLTHPGPRQ